MRIWPFFSYFFKYIFFAKTRQRLLFIAVVGLFISAFSLIVIQGIMGGLQKGLIERSKNIHGSYLIQFDSVTNESLDEIHDLLIKEAAPYYSELESEVMIKYKNYVAPAKVHGTVLKGERPKFLVNKDFSGLLLGSDLASKVHAQFLDELQIISPGVTDSLLGEVPRFVSESVSDYLYTELPEVDEFEFWGRIEIVQNLLRERGINQIRIFKQLEPYVLKKLTAIKSDVSFRLLSWEDMNGALVWSLNLETKVMLFLFIAMSLLVAIAITSGLLIFYSKIRRDLMSFWILGMPQQILIKLCFRFILIFSAIVCILGTVAGFITLRILEVYGHDIVPDIFVERRFPIELNFAHITLSFLIPFGISLVFSYLSFINFRKENQNFALIVRSVG
jgi:lipoprotein-releasing system permease protein